jgi:hypothetical protein
MRTPDGRYLIVRGRLWRTTNPSLTEAKRGEETAALMGARRAVASALRSGDEAAERSARRDVHRAKVALGERGPVWWDDGSPDYNRRLVKNTPYAKWFEETSELERVIVAMLEERDTKSSVCPSEVARRVWPKGWREHMDDVRQAARRLAAEGRVVITQKSKVLDPQSEFRGPVRIART